MSRLRAPAAAEAALRLATGRAPRGGGLVLCYHDVVPGPEVDLALNVTATRLGQHLATVRRLGFRVVPLAELSARARAGRSVDGLVALTFDDALAGVARHGLPVLVEHGAPATLFTVSTRWGQRPRWWGGSGPTMSRAELAEAAAHGMTLAAHTRTHPSLPALSRAALREEVAGCRAELEEFAEAVVPQFAYPFGHHDPRVREAVQEAGYQVAYTFLNGRVTGAEDPLRLPRLTMGRHHTPARLAYHLARNARSWPDHQLDAVPDPVSDDPVSDDPVADDPVADDPA